MLLDNISQFSTCHIGRDIQRQDIKLFSLIIWLVLADTALSHKLKILFFSTNEFFQHNMTLLAVALLELYFQDIKEHSMKLCDVLLVPGQKHCLDFSAIVERSTAADATAPVNIFDNSALTGKFWSNIVESKFNCQKNWEN